VISLFELIGDNSYIAAMTQHASGRQEGVYGAKTGAVMQVPIAIGWIKIGPIKNAALKHAVLKRIPLEECPLKEWPLKEWPLKERPLKQDP
jgi:hypothetical protein